MTGLLGVAALFVPRLRSLALLLILPYALGGLTVHISHGHPFFERDVEASLLMILMPFVLCLDPTFHVTFHRQTNGRTCST